MQTRRSWAPLWIPVRLRKVQCENHPAGPLPWFYRWAVPTGIETLCELLYSLAGSPQPATLPATLWQLTPQGTDTPSLKCWVCQKSFLQCQMDLYKFVLKNLGAIPVLVIIFSLKLGFVLQNKFIQRPGHEYSNDWTAERSSGFAARSQQVGVSFLGPGFRCQ